MHAQSCTLTSITGVSTHYSGNGEGRPVDFTHVEPLQHHLVEGSAGAAGKETVKLEMGINWNNSSLSVSFVPLNNQFFPQ